MFGGTVGVHLLLDELCWVSEERKCMAEVRDYVGRSRWYCCAPIFMFAVGRVESV